MFCTSRFAPRRGLSFHKRLDEGTFRCLDDKAVLAAGCWDASCELQVVRKYAGIPTIMGVVKRFVGFCPMVYLLE